MMQRTRLLIMTVICILFGIQPAYANAGTPLIWLSLFHLMIGNLILGLVEYNAVRVAAHVPKKTYDLGTQLIAAGLFVIANYASAWAGGYFCFIFSTLNSPVDLNNALQLLAIMYGLLFLLTLIIELPIALFATFYLKVPICKALPIILLVNLVSNLILGIAYYNTSSLSMVTQLSVIPAEEIELQRQYELYFMNRDETKVLMCSSANWNDIQNVDVNAKLYAEGFEFKIKSMTIVDLYSCESAQLLIQDFGSAPVSMSDVSLRLNPSPTQLRAYSYQPDSQWQYYGGYWPMQGLRGFNSSSNDSFHYAFETVPNGWPVSHVCHLEDQKLLFWLRPDQICLMDAETKRIAVIAHGRLPVVSYKPEVSNN